MVMIKRILPVLLFTTLCLVFSRNTFAQQAQKDTTVYTVVETMPQYPGGDDALMKYLAINISYPQAAKDKGVQGTVFVTFVVEKDGKISNVKILRGIGSGCDEPTLSKILSRQRVSDRLAKPTTRVLFDGGPDAISVCCRLAWRGRQGCAPTSHRVAQAWPDRVWGRSQDGSRVWILSMR